VLASSPNAQAAPRIQEQDAKVSMVGASDQLIVDLGISGDTLVVSTRRNYGQLSETFVHLFQRNGATRQWQFVRTLAQSLGSPNQATTPYHVAISGNVLALAGQLTVDIYEYTSGTSWTRTGQVNSGGFLPLKVDVDGTVLQSAVFCGWNAWRKSSAGTWDLVSGFTPSSASCANGAFDANGTVVMAKSPEAELWSYANVTSTQPTQRIPSFAGGNDPYFANRVALNGSGLFTVSGLQPGVHGLNRESSGWQWTDHVVEADDFTIFPAHTFPQLVASDRFVIGGQPYDPHRGPRAGSVAAYRRLPAGHFQESARLLASDARPSQQLGTHVAISGNRVAAAAVRDAVYVYDLPATEPNAIPTYADNFEVGAGGNWQNIPGSTWAIAPSGATHVYRQSSLAADAGALYTAPGDLTDQSIQADLRPTAINGDDRWFGLVVRRTDESNYYYVTLRSSNVIEIRRMRNGSFQTLARSVLPFQLNRNYRVRLEAVGTWIRTYVDGALAIETQDTGLTHGIMGVRMYKTRLDVDNVVITPNAQFQLLTDDFELQGERQQWFPESGNWVAHSEEDVPDTGTYRQTSIDADGRSVAGVVTGDQIVEARLVPLAFNTAGSPWLGLMSHYVDSGNYTYVTLRANNTISLRQLLNGNIVVLGTTPLNVTPGTGYRVRLESIGDLVRVYVNGELYLEATVRDQLPGRYGLVTYRAAADFDDVHVSQP
jgi:hypothetical protein